MTERQYSECGFCGRRSCRDCNPDVAPPFLAPKPTGTYHIVEQADAPQPALIIQHVTAVRAEERAAKDELNDCPCGIQPESFTICSAGTCGVCISARATSAAQDTQIAALRTALANIVHTFTEDSHGNMKTLPASEYQSMARAALEMSGGASKRPHPS